MKFIAVLAFGYLSCSSSRLAFLSLAVSNSFLISSGTPFLCMTSIASEYNFDINGTPHSRAAITIFFFGRCSTISTPYFSAISLTCLLVAAISNPVLKKTYFTGGAPSKCRALSIKSIKMSLSLPPEYEHIAFGCCFRRVAIIPRIAMNFSSLGKSA